MIVNGSKTVVWNGPAGVFEFDNFGKGTKALLTAVAETTANGNRGIIGGGDSATAAAKYGMEDKVRARVTTVCLVSTARPRNHRPRNQRARRLDRPRNRLPRNRCSAGSLRLDRRRRLARTARGQGAARHRRAR